MTSLSGWIGLCVAKDYAYDCSLACDSTYAIR
jgi:hypothetical protein